MLQMGYITQFTGMQKQNEYINDYKKDNDHI